MTMATDAFGNEIDPTVGYARGRFLASSADEVRRLRRVVRRVLDQMDRRGGSHTGDLFDARRPGGVCPRDGTGLRRATVGGRTTWWCPAHQS